jgi:hypothetical protein
MKYCNSCLIIAYANVGEDGAEQDAFLAAMSGLAMLDDHLCDRIEEWEIRKHQNLFQIDCRCMAHAA